MDVAQSLEDLLEELVGLHKAVTRLKTASVSGQALRQRITQTHKSWLPLAGALDRSAVIDPGTLQEVGDAWDGLVRLARRPSPKAQHRAALRTIIDLTETQLLHRFIRASGLQTIGDTLRTLVQPVTDPALLTYLDESIRCAELNCVRASVVLVWCAVAHTIHKKLVSLGLSSLNAEFAKMRADKGLLFRGFSKDYVFSTEPDVQEAADAHLILLCRFLAFLDDTQYKHLRGALDLRNGCGHPTGYQPDAVKLQAYYSDISQLVLLNPKFA